MANIVQIKRSSIPGKQPNVADLQVGELAINLADALLYSKDTTGNIIQIGGSGGSGNTSISYNDLTTANVVELNNLYYTNTRVESYVSTLGYALSSDLTTANVTEGINLYYTNARARTAISVAGAGTYDNITGVITITGDVTTEDLTTANVVELNNLYYTNSRVESYVSTLGYALSSDLTTANIVELTNLYFTNARAIGAFTAGQGIIIEANGQIVANVTGGGGGGASVTVANSAPSTPSEGDLYFDNELLKLFIYYEDDDSNQWIEASPTATSNPFEFQKAVGATAVEIYRFDKNLYRSGKFWITANSDPSYKYEEIAVIHDGANVEIAQSIYPQVEINNDPNSELRYFNADYIQPSGEYTFNAVAIAYSANIISSNVIVYGRALGGSPILSGEVKLIRT